MLLERDGELDRLERALAAAAAGNGQMVAIVGPAGIGKSSLLAEARQAGGEHGLRLLTASGSKLERAFPFGVCRQLFEPVLTGADAREREPLLAGAAAIARRLLLAAPGSERVQGESARADAYAPLHGLYWLTANLAERGPLLIAVDDAHWADAPSLRVLHYLARRLDGLPIAAVVAAREAEPGTEEDLLRAALTAPEVRVLRPDSLSEPASGAVIREAFAAEPASEFAAACRQATGGNPFYLAELLRALTSAGVEPTAGNAQRVRGVGPPAISRELLERVAQLGPGCVALVRALAVLGGRADLTLAGELAGVDEHDARAAADALFGAGIIVGGLPPCFAHPIMQAAIYEDIPPLERAAAHRRAASLLADRSAGVSEVAVHLLHTQPGRDRWTLAQLRDAVDLTLADGARGAAIDYLRRALAESPTPDERFALLRSLGSALAGHGDPEGIDMLRAATASAPDPAERAHVASLLASALVYAGRTDEAVGVVERALAGLDRAGGAAALAAQLEALLWVLGITDLDARRRVRGRLRRTVERFRRVPTGIAESVLSPLAIELVFAGATAAEVAAVAERALCTGELVHRGLAYSPLPFVAVYALIAADRPALAERTLDEAAERAAREGAPGGLALVSVTRSLARLRRGDLRGAQADAELYLRLSPEQHQEVFSPVAISTLVMVHVERGELEEAESALRPRAVGAFDPTGVLTQPLTESRARLHFAAGDPEGAIRELARCREWAAAWGDESGTWPVQWRQAMALGELRCGNPTRARELAVQDAELARRFGAPRALGRSLVALGLCQGGEQGIAVLREAADALARSEDRLEHARALVELGAALRRAGERTAARDPLSAGMRAARGCGATALAQRAYDELRAAGARPRKILYSGYEALTPSELRVARMAADGMTNRAIAQSLFVTQKTIEVHLSHAYEKLDIASRSALPAVLEAQMPGH